MAYPVVASYSTGTVTTNSSSWTLTYPANVQPDELLLAIVATDGTITPTWNSPWTEISQVGDAAVTLLAGYLNTTGTYSGNFTLGLSASEQGAWAIFRISGSLNGGIPEWAGISGTSANPTPPNLDASWGSDTNLWFAAMAADTSRTVSVYPTGTSSQMAQASGGSTGATLATCRQNQTSSSNNPSAFTISASDNWGAATLAVRPYIPTTTLVVQDSTHGHITDDVVISQIYVLSVDEATHAHSPENVTLTQLYTLSIQESSHDHNAEIPALTQVQEVVVQETLHSHTVDNVTVGGVDGRARSVWVAFKIPVSSLAVIAVNSALHSHTAENTSLVQTYVLVVQESSHAHLADNVTVTVSAIDLITQESSHAHSAENATVTQVYTLTTQECIHSHSAEIASIVQVYVLDALQTIHAHLADNVTVAISAIDLVTQESSHAHSAENATVTQAYILVVQESSHNHSAEVASLVQIYVLSAEQTLHAHQAETATLTQIYILVVQESLHAHNVDSSIITQVYVLSAQETLHAHSAENISLSQTYTLSVLECLHSHAADNITLTQFAFLRTQSDTYISGWTTDTGATTNLYEAVNEVVAVDTDYIQSEQNPSASPVVMALSSGSDPFSSSDHVFRYRYMLDGIGTVDLTVELRQDYVNESNMGTLIAQWIHNSIGAIITAEQTLSAVQADSITNYATLFVRMVANKV